jgi:putative oligomerization/nucleic acid binding protein
VWERLSASAHLLERIAMLGKPSKRLRKKLEEGGIRAQAKVLEVAEKGMAITNGAEGVAANTTLAMKCRLEITPPDGTPAFQITERFRFSQFAVPSAGQTIPVIYDAEDHEKVMLDDNPEAVQGAMLAAAGLDPNFINDALATAQSWQQQAGAAGAGGPAVVNLSGAGLGGAPAPAAPDPVAQLERLAKLHESGALTDAEFAQEKAKLLGS